MSDRRGKWGGGTPNQIFIFEIAVLDGSGSGGKIL